MSNRSGGPARTRKRPCTVAAIVCVSIFIARVILSAAKNLKLRNWRSFAVFAAQDDMRQCYRLARVALVIPCYNEANRLDTAALKDFRLPSDGVTHILVHHGGPQHPLPL